MTGNHAATLTVTSASVLLLKTAARCRAEALGRLELCTNQLEGPPISLAYLPPTSWGSSSSLCSQFCRGNDSCTFFPVTSDAFRQTWTNLLFNSLNSRQLGFAQAWLRRVCRVCSNAEFWCPTKGREQSCKKQEILDVAIMSYRASRWRKTIHPWPGEELPVSTISCLGSLLRQPIQEPVCSCGCGAFLRTCCPLTRSWALPLLSSSLPVPWQVFFFSFCQRYSLLFSL